MMRMFLNNTSYVHIKIKKLCSQLELLSGTKLITDLNDEFNEIRFIDKLGYIVLDFNNLAIFTLGRKLDPVQLQLATDIINYCDFIIVGIEYGKRGYKYGNNSKQKRRGS